MQKYSGISQKNESVAEATMSSFYCHRVKKVFACVTWMSLPLYLHNVFHKLGYCLCMGTQEAPHGCLYGYDD